MHSLQASAKTIPREQEININYMCVHCSFIFDSLLFADLFLNILKLAKFNNQYRIAIECG